MKRINFVAAAIAATALTVSITSAQASNLRIEGGVGYDISTSNLSANTNLLGGNLQINNNGTGGDGLAANAALWLDGMFGPPQTLLGDLSIGAQYLHFTNDHSLSGSFTEGPDSAGGIIKEGLDVNAVMANIAWRPGFGPLHPFIGVGGGVAFTNLTGSINIPFFAFGASTHDSETAAAGQAFVGFDYDVTNHLYFGASGTFFYTDTSYNKFIPGINIDDQDKQLSLQAHVGWRF